MNRNSKISKHSKNSNYSEFMDRNSLKRNTNTVKSRRNTNAVKSRRNANAVKSRRNTHTVKPRKLNKLKLSITAMLLLTTILGTKAMLTYFKNKEVNSNIQLANKAGMPSQAGLDSERVTWITTTEDDGSEKMVPIPKGFSASRVPGENTIGGGFVIYEIKGDDSGKWTLEDMSDLDWDKILPNEGNDITIKAITSSSNETQNTTAMANSISTEDENNNEEEINDENSIENEVTENTTDLNDENNAITENSEDKTGKTNQTEKQENEQTDNLKNETSNVQASANSSDISQSDNNENKSLDETNNSNSGQSDNDENTENEEEIYDEDFIEEENEEDNQEQQEKENNLDPQNTEQNANTGSLQNENLTEAGLLAAEQDATEGDGSETSTPTQEDINVFELQKTHNQYVWVPIDVDDITKLYGVDSNGKLWGKLYTYAADGRTNNNWSESNGVMNITYLNDKDNYNKITNYREPDVTKYRTNYDIDSKLNNYLYGQTEYELLSKEMEQNFYEMIKSIEKYGGFYIGRYETGRKASSQTSEFVVRKMNTNLNNISWYNSYKGCKQLRGDNENIVTSLISGALWDATLDWLAPTVATNSDKYSGITNSTSWGNYSDSTFTYLTTDGESTTKAAKSSTMIPAGSADYTKKNNIYDLAGNVYEWTLEATSSSYRVFRGGYCGNSGSDYPASYRDNYFPAYVSNGVRFSCLLLY